MQITRIFHSGFLVETAKRYFIFDYYKGELPKLNPDKPVYAVSYTHLDVYKRQPLPMAVKRMPFW